MATKPPLPDLDAIGQANIKYTPPLIAKHVKGPLTFSEGSGPDIAQAHSFDRNISVNNLPLFLENARQIVPHEVDHEAQYDLPGVRENPALLEKMFRPNNPSNLYGDFASSTAPQHALIERAKGHNIAQTSPEEQGMMAQQWAFNNEQAEKNPQLANQLHTANQAYEPYFEDFDQIARYGHVLNQADADQADIEARAGLKQPIPKVFTPKVQGNQLAKNINP